MENRDFFKRFFEDLVELRQFSQSAEEGLIGTGGYWRQDKSEDLKNSDMQWQINPLVSAFLNTHTQTLYIVYIYISTHTRTCMCSNIHRCVSVVRYQKRRCTAAWLRPYLLYSRAEWPNLFTSWWRPGRGRTDHLLQARIKERLFEKSTPGIINDST